MNRSEQITHLLELAFPESKIEVLDHSALHYGHKEAQKSGGGHFEVTIISAKFNQLSKIARHRLVYQALGHLINTEIHALQINALDADTAK